MNNTIAILLLLSALLLVALIVKGNGVGSLPAIARMQSLETVVANPPTITISWTCLIQGTNEYTLLRHSTNFINWATYGEWPTQTNMSVTVPATNPQDFFHPENQFGQ